MADVMVELEEIFDDAEQFVEKHYKYVDAKDRGIKILATINQIIELKQLPPSDFTLIFNGLLEYLKTQKEQKGQ